MNLHDFYTPIVDYDTLQKVSLILNFLGKNTSYIDRNSKIKFPIGLYCVGNSTLDYIAARKNINPDHKDYDIFKRNNLKLITVEEIFNM